jgi:hypothetical protein
MGYRKIKTHYDIKHIVAIYDKKAFGGRCICIGSYLCHDIIVINISSAKVVKHYTERSYSANEDLARYDEALKIDEENGTLRKLIDEPDVFTASIPVFTTNNGFVIREFCEEYGWPNATHAGNIMHENTYFRTREMAYECLLKETSRPFRYSSLRRHIKEAANKIKMDFYFLTGNCRDWLLARTAGKFITKKA